MPKFREVFHTPFDQYKEHIGKRFEVLRELTDEERDPEVGTMYKIKLETGETIDAWPEEVEDLIVVGSGCYMLPEDVWVVVSDDGFWSNNLGWVYTIESATIFTATQKQKSSLPVGTNVRWATVADARHLNFDEEGTL